MKLSDALLKVREINEQIRKLEFKIMELIIEQRKLLLEYDPVTAATLAKMEMETKR